MTTSPGHFVGRRSQLDLLDKDLAAVRRSGRGRFVVIRGRRRVGKSRLVSEFLLRHRVPSVFYAATPSGPDRELGRFTEAVGRSSLAAATLVRSRTSFGSWEAALSTIAMSADEACVVVVDELPHLVDGHVDLEAQLQHV